MSESVNQVFPFYSAHFTCYNSSCHIVYILLWLPPLIEHYPFSWNLSIYNQSSTRPSNSYGRLCSFLTWILLCVQYSIIAGHYLRMPDINQDRYGMQCASSSSSSSSSFHSTFFINVNLHVHCFVTVRLLCHITPHVLHYQACQSMWEEDSVVVYACWDHCAAV